MRKRYMPQPAWSDWQLAGESETAGELIEVEGLREPEPIGILDANGNMICRMPQPFGFRGKNNA